MINLIQMAEINIFNKLSIKNKTYLLVLLSVVVALVLLLVSNNGLNAIRTEQNNLIFSTKIERYTNKLIHEEQQYRLNTNGSVYNFTVANQAYDSALDYANKIYQILKTPSTQTIVASSWRIRKSPVNQQTNIKFCT